MHNILTTVIGIALAGSAATMTTSYAGDAFSKASDRVVAADAISVASQVSAALRLYDLQEGAAYASGSLEGLVEARYLTAVPPNPARGGGLRIDEEARAVLVPLPAGGGGVCSAAGGMGDGRHAGCATVDGGEAVFVGA